MKFAQQEEASFTLILKGYDVTVQNSEVGDGFYTVILNESGNTVYSVDIPVDMEEDTELLTEDVVNYAAQAAIDLYEAQRGTLGQGAGALEIQAMKKRAYLSSWFGLSCECKDALQVLKGTSFEEQAFSLVQQIVELDYNQQALEQGNPELEAQLDKVCKNLTLLELELYKSKPKDTKIIVIQGIKKYALDSWELGKVQEYLDQFIGSNLENKALMLMQDYLSLKRQLTSQEIPEEEIRQQRQDLALALNNLVLENLQSQVEVKLPDFGVDAFPSVTSDVVSLMENVEVEDPSIFGGMWAGKVSFHENETETPIEKLPAPEEGDWEEDYKRKEFQKHDKVTLSKDLVVAQFGEEKVVPKGTSGKVNGLFDEQDNCLYVWFDGFGIFRTPIDSLSK
jgi:hypothetical protein